METRDQWYKPNLLYNIHWRPPKTPDPPKMIVKTVRFNPSVCTCGEHSCEPHYRMERKVVWINKETTSRTIEEKEKEEFQESDSWKELRSDQEVESKRNEVLHSKEDKTSDRKYKGDTNDNERCTEKEIFNRVVTKDSFSVGYGKRSKIDNNRKYDKIKVSFETEGLNNQDGGDEFSIKREWLEKGKEDSWGGCKTDDLEIIDGTERKGEENDSIDSDGLKKYHREALVNELNGNCNYNVRTNERGKCSGAGYVIATGGSIKSESDGESGGARLINKCVENGDVKGEGNGTKVKMDTLDNKSDGIIVGEDIKSDLERNNGQYNHGFSTEDKVRNDDRCNGKADHGERYVNNSGKSLEENVTEEDFLDEEISPAFGIMSIYCNSELHYNILGSCA